MIKFYGEPQSTTSNTTWMLTTASMFGTFSITSDDDLADIEITANGHTYDISVSVNGHFEAETELTQQEAITTLNWFMRQDWTALRPTAKHYVVNFLTAMIS